MRRRSTAHRAGHGRYALMWAGFASAPLYILAAIVAA